MFPVPLDAQVALLACMFRRPQLLDIKIRADGSVRRWQEEQRQKKEADGRQREVAQRAAREKEAAKQGASKEVGP